MAQNDYHVVIFRILNYLYTQLKDGAEVDCKKISANTLEINERYFNYIILELINNNYITGAYPIEVPGANYTKCKITSNINITVKGIEYLTDNSFLDKAKKYLNLINKDIIPFVKDI